MRSPLKLSLTMGADKRAAEQRRARPLPLYRLRTYPSPKPRSLFISLSRSMCFQCVCTRASTCASLLSSVKSNRVIYTRGKVWSLRSAGHIVFIPLPISSIQQMTEASEGCGAEQPNCRVTASYQGCLAAQQMDEGKPEHRRDPAIQDTLRSLQLKAGFHH